MKRLRFFVSSSHFRRIFFFLGLILFGILIYKFQPAVLWSYLKKLGPRMLWILLVGGLAQILYSLAWEIFLKNLSKRVRFSDIFRIKVSGEAINSFTPFSWGGGDPARIYFLKKHLPLSEGTASVVVDRTLNNFAAALFILIGILLTLYLFSLPLKLQIGLSLALLFLITISIFLYSRSHEGLFEFILDVLKKLRIKKSFSEATLQKVAEIDHHISDFYKMNKKGFLSAFGFHFLGRLTAVVEIFLIAMFLGHPLTFLQSYLLASMTVIVNLVFVFVPGSLGVMEGAYAGIFSLFGLNPALGTSIQITRRLRMIFFGILGFIFMAGFRRD